MSKKILILGGDGYLGWPTAMHFSSKGHEVTVVDNFLKRKWEMEWGVQPLIAIAPLHVRVRTWNEISKHQITMMVGDLTNDRFVFKLLEREKPDAIVHYAEQPSAPFSMAGRSQAVSTQVNNIVGTLNLLFAVKRFCPDAHLIKLGTMGEYGTPNIDIEEGFITIEHNGRSDTVPFPKQPFSFYHLSKVHDSHNIQFACKVWGLRATDLNQGIVYGIDTPQTAMDPHLCTSFHYDEVFGTVLNRFCVQAVSNEPLTVYGKGGQKRGYLNIVDTLQCVELTADNPPPAGEYRVFNQFTEVFSINELAQIVQEVGKQHDLDVAITHLPNPRIEKDDHYYNPKNTRLKELGLKSHKVSDVLLNDIINKIIKAKSSIDHHIIQPTVKWRQDN
jgi:UDP-sulfoquinovose synthase